MLFVLVKSSSIDFKEEGETTMTAGEVALFISFLMLILIIGSYANAAGNQFIVIGNVRINVPVASSFNSGASTRMAR